MSFTLRAQIAAKVEITPRPKLSSKIIVGKVKVPADEKPVYLYEVAGVAYTTQRGTSDKGEWVKLLGDFIACNVQTGKLFRSMSLFLPNVAGNLVVGGLRNGTAFKFAFRLGVVKDDDSVTGFVYFAEPLVDTAQADPNRLLADVLDTPMLTQGSAGHDRDTGEVIEQKPAPAQGKGKQSKAA